MSRIEVSEFIKISGGAVKNGNSDVGASRGRKNFVDTLASSDKVKEIGKRTLVRQYGWRLFITCWIVFSLHFATNTVREIYPALSLGDSFSFDVSEYADLHPDIFRLDDRGAFINNNPGASIMGAIPYFLLRPLTDRVIERVQRQRAMENSDASAANYDSAYPMAREFYQKSRAKGFDIKFGLAAAEMQFFVMSPMTALSVVVMFQILFQLTRDARSSVWLAALYAFATPIFFRAAQLNQNLLAADFALFAFWFLWRTKPNKNAFYFLGGLCAGWTVLLDYSGIAALVCLSGYAAAHWFEQEKMNRRRFDLIKFAAGASIGILILWSCQWICFGNPFLPAQSYMPPANYTELGFRGFSFPQADLFLSTAFSLRYGLFVSAPVLLLAFAFPVWLRRKNRWLQKRELIFCLTFIAVYFLFCAANQYGRMQFNSGVRHIVPVVPFVFLLAANVLLKMPRRLAVLLGIFGVYWSWCLVMYRDVEQGLGVFEAVKNITFEGFRLPWLTVLEKMNFIAHASPFPLFLLSAAMIWTLWTVNRNKKISRSF